MPFAFDYSLSDLRASALWPALLAGLAGIGLGAAIASKPLAVVGLCAVAFAVFGVVVALERPGVAFGGLVLLMALAPVYAAPSIGSLLFLPAAATSCVIAIALGWRNLVTRGRLFRLTLIDFAALVFALLMGISLFYSLRTSNSDYLNYLFIWGAPYLAARMLLADTRKPAKVLAISFAIALLCLAPLAVLESLGVSNPFYNLNFNSAAFAVWASQVDRFGAIRAVTSFGHPIAFSMFAAAAALLALGMGLHAKTGRQRYTWYLLTLIGVGTQALALSRTGWLMLATGIVAIALLGVRGAARRRLGGILAIVVAAVLVVAVAMPSQLQIIPGAGEKSEQSFQSSGLYREALLHRALQPGVLHLWGNPVNKVTPAVNFGSATDNAYIILADTWGLIPTFALFGLGAALLIAAARTGDRRDEPLASVPIVAFTTLVAIFFVAFITQQQVMIWMLLGAAGATAERAAGERRRERQRLSSEAERR